MEKDNDTYGEGNAYDFGARIYDGRLGRWLSVDPSQAKYPYLTPYNSFENNPIYFNDPDGKDAGYTIHGNTITFTSQIYIYGEGANQAKAKEIQDQIMSVWGNEFNSQGYTVKFDITVSVYDKSSKEMKDNFQKGTANFVFLKKSVRDHVKAGGGVGGRYGVWSTNKKAGVRAHEAGHFLGIDDAYYTKYEKISGGAANAEYKESDTDFPGIKKDDVMGRGAHSKSPKVKQFDVDELVKVALNNPNNKKDASGKINGTISAGKMNIGGTTEANKATYKEPAPLTTTDKIKH